MELKLIIIGILSVVLILIIESIYIYYLKKRVNNLSIDRDRSINKNNIINIKQTKQTFDFFNELLEIKFRYYLTSEILAYFLNGKEIPKKEIIKLKENFYIDVTKTLNKNQRENILKIFSNEGIEMYIHQTFLKLLNDCNIKYIKTDELDQKTINAIYNDKK